MRNKKTFDLVITSMFVALIILMAYVPFLGYISIGVVNYTIIHIPVIVFAILFGARRGGFIGIVFGLSSLAIAFLRPSTPLSFLFQNPLVSVLPRFLFGLSVYPTYVLFKKLVKSNVLSALITAFVGTIIHALLVLPSMYAIYKLGWVFDQDVLKSIRDIVLAIGGQDNLFKFMLAIIGSNTLIEALLAALIVPPLYKALRTLSESRK